MSLRPCIAKFSCSFSATLRLPIPSVTRVERRHLSSRALTVEFQRTLDKGVLKNLKGLHDELKVAVEKKNVDELCFNLTSSRRLFFALPKFAWQQVRETHLLLSGAGLEEIARMLARRSKKGDAEALGQLLRDAKAMYGVEPSAELLLSALSSLIRTGQQLQAYDLLQLFNNYKVKSFRPSPQHWRIVMRGLAQIGDVERLKECLTTMKTSLPFPGNPHYHALLEGFLHLPDPPSVDEMHQILDEIRKLNLPYDAAIEGVLARIAKAYGPDSLPFEYKKGYDSKIGPTEAQVQYWLKGLIRYRKNARAAFEVKLISLRHDGFVPDDRTLSRLVQISSIVSPDELIYLQEAFGFPPNTITWSILLRNVLEKNGWQGAIAAYDVARSQGVKPDSAMLHPLLRAMCGKFIQGPSGPALDKALEMYKDLKEEAKNTGKPGADTALFNTLLRALASNKNKRKYFPIALSLLEDMRSLGVVMDRMTTTSIAVLLVRSSSTYQEAAKAYKQVRSVNAEGLDQKGYAAVLHAFCSLEPEYDPSLDLPEGQSEPDNNRTILLTAVTKKIERPFPVPPAELYFSILQDMYAHGFYKSAEVYTILLGRYAALATRARSVQDPQRRDTIVSLLRTVINETHRQITTEAGLVPDAPLLNQLMDTYNRAGLFHDVMQVWTLINSTGLLTPTSVSIMFDACGYHKQSRFADEVLRDLKGRGFRLNRRNWNSWVECLCRVNRLDEAVEVVCAEMANARDPEVRPDEHTVQVLLSFASAHGRFEEVQSHLRTRLPALLPSE